MRKYVLDFLQDNIVALGLKANDIFILSYMIDFFSSGNAKMCFLDGKRCYYITYNKILTDLKFLQIKERRLRYILDNLSEKNVIFKKTIKHREMYVHINTNMLIEPLENFPPSNLSSTNKNHLNIAQNNQIENIKQSTKNPSNPNCIKPSNTPISKNSKNSKTNKNIYTKKHKKIFDTIRKTKTINLKIIKKLFNFITNKYNNFQHQKMLIRKLINKKNLTHLHPVPS